MLDWQNIIKTFPEANFLQSPVWGKVNELIGHTVICEKGELTDCGLRNNADPKHTAICEKGELTDQIPEHSATTQKTHGTQESHRTQAASLETARSTGLNKDADPNQDPITDKKPNPNKDVTLNEDASRNKSQLRSKTTSTRRVFWCQMIVKDAKRGRYLEVPGGPLLDWNDRALVEAVFAKIKTIAEAQNCVFVRLRPQLPAPELSKLDGLGLQKAPMHLHAEHTVILDLTKSAETLLKEMRRQTRYEVRRAEKLGLTVDWSDTEAAFQEFHEVQAQTAQRQHFIPPDLKTLLAERTAFGANARLYQARTAEGEPVAYGLIMIDGNEAEYFEAASTELNHKLPGAYALQWQVIQDLQRLGLKRYNLWGIAPANQPEHRYARVTTFKKGFGGEVVEFVPAQDLVIKHNRYLVNQAVETIRKKVRHL